MITNIFPNHLVNVITSPNNSTAAIVCTAAFAVPLMLFVRDDVCLICKNTAILIKNPARPVAKIPAQS